MPFLLAIISLLGGAAFWFYRMRDIGYGASHAVDRAQRLRGFYRRKRFRQKAESSAVSAIDDPAVAAVTFLVALAASRGFLSPAAEAAIKAELQERIGAAKPDEVFIFARWAADHAPGPGDMTLHFTPLWARTLNASERQDLFDMAARIAAVDGEPTPLQKGCLNTLRAKLGLTRG